MLTCGIDEAGRGAVIGPLVMACVVVDERGMEGFKQLGVKDSKRLSKKKRGSLEQKIKDISVEYKILQIQAFEIDHLRKKLSLNVIEAETASRLILPLSTTPDKIIVDAVDVVEERYRQNILAYMKKTDKESVNGINIISEHKADDNYIEVGAASILAKVERDRQIENLHKKCGYFGSGYPSDSRTMEFIEGLEELPDWVRKSWICVKRLKDKEKQSVLGDF